jgi:hypothetical protein
MRGRRQGECGAKRSDGGHNGVKGTDHGNFLLERQRQPIRNGWCSLPWCARCGPRTHLLERRADALGRRKRSCQINGANLCVLLVVQAVRAKMVARTLLLDLGQRRCLPATSSAAMPRAASAPSCPERLTGDEQEHLEFEGSPGTHWKRQHRGRPRQHRRRCPS